MSKAKLTYFDVRARGELARLVLTAAKKDFEDCRIGFEDWGKMKPTSKYGSLPTLEWNGKEYFQGNAIATFLARECGLYGKTNLDGLVIDMCVDLKEDTLQEEAKTIFGSDEDKAAAAKKLTETVYPRSFKIWNDCIKQNGGWVAGGSLSLGDMAIYEGTQLCFQNNPKVLDGFPEIKALRAKVEGSPQLKDYLSKRKQTPL